MELKIVFNDGTEDLSGIEDSKIRLTDYGIESIAVTSDKIIPWHRIKEVIRTPGSD